MGLLCTCCRSSERRSGGYVRVQGRARAVVHRELRRRRCAERPEHVGGGARQREGDVLLREGHPHPHDDRLPSLTPLEESIRSSPGAGGLRSPR